jgi:ABC-type transporter Mla subunit MlaD
MEEFDPVLWIQNNFVITIFVVIQVVLLIYAWIRLTKRAEWHTYTNTWASILTVIGIFGTFLGIFIGLQAFKIENIDGSIPVLLEGLKIAFLTSLIGIFSAIILKWKGLHQDQKSDPSDETIKKFADELKKAWESVENPWESNFSSKLDDLITVVREDSRITQDVLSGMRTDLTEGQSKTLTQLETLTTVSEKHSESLNGVIPLLTTIQDSLTNEEIGVLAKLEVLTTTVSEKQNELLNGVKDALTPIQTSLMDEQIGVLTKLETLTVTVSDEHNKLRTKFEIFSNDVAEKIADLANEELVGALKTVIDEFNTNMVEQFGENFRHLNEAVDSMVGWQEQYRQQMDELASEFRIAAESIEQSGGSLENIANSSSAIVERSDSIVACAEKLEPILNTMNGQLETFSELRQKAEDSLPIINSNIDELTTNFSSKIQEAITAAETSIETQRAALERQSQQLDNDLRQNVQTIRDGLEQALTESLNGLVGQLTSLSRQFVEDYEPLTIRLQRLVDLARNVEDEPNF